MTELTRTRAHDLALALRHYLAGTEELARLRAYEVARDAMAKGTGLLDLVAEHQEALAIVLSGEWSPEASIRAINASAQLMAESLGPFEMAHRGFQEANATLLQVNNDLKRQVAERKRAEEAARLASETADQANRAKSEFLSRMSHELRTPLNAVLGFAQILELDDLTSEQRESAEQIIKAGRHLLELINEVLDIARIETGQLALSIEPVPVREVLTEALDLVRPLATCSDIRLVDDASRLARSAFADRQRLRQVLINLLSNAVKYNRPGGRVIATWEEPVGEGIRITISDAGTGIDPEKMDRLFSPFDRLGAEESGIEGVGLGLALSRRLMEAMGGTLEAQSRVGEGSRFTVTLRLADAGISESPSGYWMSSPQIESLRTSGTVLCIEDNASNMRLVERALQTRPGVVLLSASTGQVGLELARERHPDLVLLDMQLPDVAGEEVLRLLQSHPDTQEIPVLVLSADATSIRIEQAVAAGAVGYLTKPLDLQLFLSKIDGFLSGGRAS